MNNRLARWPRCPIRYFLVAEKAKPEWGTNRKVFVMKLFWLFSSFQFCQWSENKYFSKRLFLQSCKQCFFLQNWFFCLVSKENPLLLAKTRKHSEIICFAFAFGNQNTLSHIYGVGTSDIDEIDTALGNCKCQRRLSSGWFLSIAITCWVPPGVTPVVLQHNPETFDESLLGWTRLQGAGLQR